MAAASSIALGGLALGGLAGAMAGSQGTPDQTTTTTRGIAAATPEEERLREQSRQQYEAQLAQLQAQERALADVGRLREQSLAGYEGILTGRDLQASPEELANINRIREAQIGLGQQDIQNFLNQATAQTNRSAGVRNLRGQALAELQGRNVQAAGQEIGRLVGAANLQAAQSAQNAPFQRIAAQSPFLQQGLTYQDELRQRAVQNRQAAQNPALMQALQNERLATVSQTQFTPGREATFTDVLAGGIGGAAGGFNLGAQAGGAFQSLRPQQAPQARSGYGGQVPMNYYDAQYMNMRG